MPVYNRHNEVFILDRKPGRVEARHFNIAQTALKRNKGPLRFKIPTLNHLDLLVQEDAWIVVDRVLHDMPVACWTDFDTDKRDNLHKPVTCEIRIYHFAARMVLRTALDVLANILGNSLAKRDNAGMDNIITMNKER